MGGQGRRGLPHSGASAHHESTARGSFAVSTGIRLAGGWRARKPAANRCNGPGGRPGAPAMGVKRLAGDEASRASAGGMTGCYGDPDWPPTVRVRRARARWCHIGERSVRPSANATVSRAPHTACWLLMCSFHGRQPNPLAEGWPGSNSDGTPGRGLRLQVGACARSTSLVVVR